MIKYSVYCMRCCMNEWSWTSFWSWFVTNCCVGESGTRPTAEDISPSSTVPSIDLYIYICAIEHHVCIYILLYNSCMLCYRLYKINVFVYIWFHCVVFVEIFILSRRIVRLISRMCLDPWMNLHFSNRAWVDRKPENRSWLLQITYLASIRCSDWMTLVL